jgi:hypothetical protein
VGSVLSRRVVSRSASGRFASSRRTSVSSWARPTGR